MRLAVLLLGAPLCLSFGIAIGFLLNRPTTAPVLQLAEGSPDEVEAPARETFRSAERRRPWATPRVTSTDGGGGPSTEPVVERVPPPDESDEELMARLFAEDKRRQEWFRAEPYDSSWASEKERALDERLVELQQKLGSFGFANVECKTSQCRTTVTWPRGADATAGQEIAHADFGRCAIHVRSNSPEAADDTGTSEVHFDCTPERSEAVQ